MYKSSKQIQYAPERFGLWLLPELSLVLPAPSWLKKSHPNITASGAGNVDLTEEVMDLTREVVALYEMMGGRRPAVEGLPPVAP
jgi:hypothetical protein